MATRYLGDIMCDECLCEAPTAPEVASPSPSLAMLMLGHRRRLMWRTLPSMVVKPSVQRGYSTDAFAILESGPMATPYAHSRAVYSDAAFAALDDDALREVLSTDVRAAGGGVGAQEPRKSSSSRRGEGAG